jgi:ATP-dependent RNA helicase DeaD
LQERSLPDDEDVERIVSERIIVLLEARLRNRDRLQTERMHRFYPLARGLGQEEENNLLAMLLDDFYQGTFHAPFVPPQSLAKEAGASKRPRSRERDRRTPRQSKRR